MARSRYGIHPAVGYTLFGLAVAAATATYMVSKQREQDLKKLPPKTEVKGPLRPPPPEPEDPEPGPLARELSDFIDSLGDKDVKALREAIPAEWWEYTVLATYAPDDDTFRFVFHPLTISIEMMSDEDFDRFARSLVWAIGPFDAMRLQEFFIKAGVLPEESTS